MTQQQRDIINLKIQSKIYSLLAIAIASGIFWGTMYFLLRTLQ